MRIVDIPKDFFHALWLTKGLRDSGSTNLRCFRATQSHPWVFLSTASKPAESTYTTVEHSQITSSKHT